MEKKSFGIMRVIFIIVIIILLLLSASYIGYDKLVIDKNSNKLLDEATQKFNDVQNEIEKLESDTKYITVGPNLLLGEQFKVYGTNGNITVFGYKGNLYVTRSWIKSSDSSDENKVTTVKEDEVSKVVMNRAYSKETFFVIYKDGRVKAISTKCAENSDSCFYNYELVEKFEFSEYKVKDIQFACNQSSTDAEKCNEFDLTLKLSDGTEKIVKY